VSEAPDWDTTPEEPDWLAAQRSEAARHATDDDAPDDLQPEDRPPAWPPAPPARPAPAPAAPPTLTVVQNTNTNALADGHRATDAGNSDRLAEMAAGRIRYVQKWGRWIVYTGGRWRIDEGDALITEIAKQVPRHMFARSIDLHGDARDHMFKWAKRSESAAAISSAIRLARGIPGVIVDHTELDTHPWLLNVRNGTVDLRTGQLGPHDPAHLITCQSPVTFDPDAACPTWDGCLAMWQPDPVMRAYLAKVIGTAASGDPVEHVFINLGTGANGKGKFYGAVQAVLGPDYSVVPHKSLLIVQRHEQHDTVKARLFGARMAVAGETEAGDRLDEAKVKELTGGDLLEARRMREDPWKFAPSHSLFLHTNHRPRVRGGDEGIWRRIHLIPWDVTIPPERRDGRLADKLEAEASGILNWIIAGCLAWQAEGLQPPPAVTDAVDSYRAEEDHVGRFLTECCVLDPKAHVSAKALRAAYEQWCDDVGETPWSAKALGPHLLSKGLDRTQEGREKAWTWIGVGLISNATPSEMF